MTKALKAAARQKQPDCRQTKAYVASEDSGKLYKRQGFEEAPSEWQEMHKFFSTMQQKEREFLCTGLNLMKDHIIAENKSFHSSLLDCLSTIMDTVRSKKFKDAEKKIEALRKFL